MNTDPETTEARPQDASFYPTLWRAVPREVGFLLVSFPITLTGFVATITLFSIGIGTLALFLIGVPVIVGALYAARGFGTLELTLLDWVGRPPIVRPLWPDARASEGLLAWLRAVFGSAHYWLYLGYSLIVGFTLSTVSWTLTIVWLSGGLGGATYWIWGGFVTGNTRDWYLSEWLAGVFGWPTAGADYLLIDPFVYLILGAAFVATLPFVSRGLVVAHATVARAMLGAFRSSVLEREVRDLSVSRGAAISAEGHSLRRLERDIHDGPQQRLVRLQMDLAAADRQLDADPGKARGLIAEAMEQSREALDELRALSRGFAPPILLDRGLIAALESAAVRNTIPSRIVNELPEGTQLPQEIERNAYFVASEALVNAARHSGATSVEVRVGSRLVPESDETWLDVTITDDGRGGAAALDGHGISGLQERLRGLGGTLELSSPRGGPTVIAAHVPLTASAPTAGSAGSQ